MNTGASGSAGKSLGAVQICLGVGRSPRRAVRCDAGGWFRVRAAGAGVYMPDAQNPRRPRQQSRSETKESLSKSCLCLQGRKDPEGACVYDYSGRVGLACRGSGLRYYPAYGRMDCNASDAVLDRQGLALPRRPAPHMPHLHTLKPCNAPADCLRLSVHLFARVYRNEQR